MPEEKGKPYCSMEVGFYQAELPISMSAELIVNLKSQEDWRFKIWQKDLGKHVFTGNLQETTECILLGKFCKEHLLLANTVLVG